MHHTFASLTASVMTDIVLGVGVLLSAPWWLYRLIATGKIRTDWAGRFGKTAHLGWVAGPPDPARRRILFNAVSVGEVNAIRRLVETLAADSDQFEIVIAVTTNTGYQRAREIFGDLSVDAAAAERRSPHQVLRYPLDFSFAVSRFLNAVQPDLVVLVELEVWPNFSRACVQRDIPTVVANGRLSARSFKCYSRFRWVIAPMFRRLSAVAAQDEVIAERFRALGVPTDRVQALGTMKWDNVTVGEQVAGADELAASFGIDRSRPIVVAGSTAEGEEALVHRAVPSDVQLIVAPRKPERFTEAAVALPDCVRRTDCKKMPNTNHGTTRFLLDTIGELRAAYSLADVVIVGRSFGNLYGSDMIEPVALGKATIVGPRTSDFESIMHALLAAEAIRQVNSPEDLEREIARLLNDAPARDGLAERGLQCVRQQQGSVQRHAELIRSIFPSEHH